MKLTALLTAAALVLVLSACTAAAPDTAAANPLPAPNQPVSLTAQEKAPEQSAAQKTPTLLTREEAIAVALKAAGVTKAEVRDLDAELDREREATVWEVDFESGRTEYSYELDAQTGKILHRETERD